MSAALASLSRSVSHISLESKSSIEPLTSWRIPELEKTDVGHSVKDHAADYSRLSVDEMSAESPECDALLSASELLSTSREI